MKRGRLGPASPSSSSLTLLFYAFFFFSVSVCCVFFSLFKIKWDFLSVEKEGTMSWLFLILSCLRQSEIRM